MCLLLFSVMFMYHRFLHEDCFWGQTVRGTRKESPLVSVNEHPLIVPARVSQLSRLLVVKTSSVKRNLSLTLMDQSEKQVTGPPHSLSAYGLWPSQT